MNISFPLPVPATGTFTKMVPDAEPFAARRPAVRGLAMRTLIMALLLSVLTACSGTPLSPGLVARMDQPGASLNKAEALQLINQYRASRGAPSLALDPALDTRAEALADSYARTSNRPRINDPSLRQVRFSAGYANFAETFSGWRGTREDADAIADPGATRAGLGVAYSPDSSYGIHWVLLLGAPETPPEPDSPAPTPASR